MKNPLVFSNPSVAIKLTPKQAELLQIDINKDVIHGKMKTRGVWGIPVSYKAICMTAVYTKDIYTKCTEKTIIGIRALSNIKQGGYELEGYVSIKGKKHSAFTSSQLFEIEGKLIDVAIIHVRQIQNNI